MECRHIETGLRCVLENLDGNRQSAERGDSGKQMELKSWRTVRGHTPSRLCPSHNGSEGFSTSLTLCCDGVFSGSERPELQTVYCWSFSEFHKHY